MRRAAFEALTLEYGTRCASRLSGFPRSLHYYQPAKRHTDPRLDTEALQAIEKQVTEHPSYGVRRITAMLRRAGIQVSRKKVYRIMKLANLVRKKSMRKHFIVKQLLTVPDKPDCLWQQDITYIWCGNDGWCYLFSILDCYKGMALLHIQHTVRY
jgi:putative transposase